VRVFYEDLSEYAYQDEDAFTDRESDVYTLWYRSAYTRLSIGLLEVGKPYSTGTVPAVFMHKLHGVQKVQSMNLCLGLHQCNLCPEQETPAGNGEVRIPGEPGITYTAPFLITHHITAHGYRPPQVINAVPTVDLDPWTTARWPNTPSPWVPDDEEHMLEQRRANLRAQPEPTESTSVVDHPKKNVSSSAGRSSAPHHCGTGRSPRRTRPDDHPYYRGTAG
jgi:hypothetical protein